VSRARAGYIVIALVAGVLFLVLRPHIQPYDSRAGLAKALVAGAALLCVLYEGSRRRPVSEATKRFAALTLAAVALLC
jgi:peptidoglycan/LPS O-acetylase OafA/YrhL